MTPETPTTAPRRAPAWVMTGLLGLSVAGGVAWLMVDRPASATDGTASATAEVGAVAKLDYTLKDLDGKDVKLADFRGRPVVLNFWATYCGPCKTEIPIFVELFEKYRDRKVAILGISVDDSPEDLRPFVAEYKMNYPVLLGLGHDELMERYEAGFLIPITWFIKPDGTIYLKHPGSAPKEWFEQQIQALLPAGTDRP